MARGKYICFLDSDDLLTPTALEELYSTAENLQADVLRADTSYRYKQGIGINKVNTLPVIRSGFSVDKITIESGDVLARVRKFINGRAGGHPPWKHFVLRELLIENKIEFPKLHILEDNFFAFCLFACAKKFAFIPNTVYIYRWRSDSISHKKRPIDNDVLEYITDISSAIQSIDEFMNSREFFQQHPEWKLYLFNYIFRRRRVAFSQIPKLSVVDLYKRYNNISETFFEVFGGLQFTSAAKIAAYYFCVTTGLQSDVVRLNSDLERLGVFAKLNKIQQIEGGVLSYFDTLLTVNENASKITHSGDVPNAVKMSTSDGKFSFYVPARKSFIANISTGGDITLQDAECFVGEIVSNPNQTVSFKFDDGFLSARKDGACLLMKEKLAWEFFRTV